MPPLKSNLIFLKAKLIWLFPELIYPAFFKAHSLYLWENFAKIQI